MPRILVVDNNPNVRETVRLVLSDLAPVGTASLSDDVMTQLAREPAELLVLGLSPPLEEPLRILREVLLADPNVRILILSDRELLSAAQRIFNYRIEAILAQPFDAHELRQRATSILSGHDRLPTLREVLEQETSGPPSRSHDLSLLLPGTLHPFFLRIADSTAHVVIEGERGTGKTALAHRLHVESPWRNAPYERIDGWAVTEARINATLDRLAGNGSPRERVATLCVEEIGRLSPELHPLLRDIAEGSFPPGTSPRIARMTFRLIVTTTEPLSDLASRGAIQRELRDALAVLSLRLPALRERGSELDTLSTAMADDWARRYGRASPGFSQAALERLHTYLWPGNLRELRAVVGRALAITEGDEVSGEAISFVEGASHHSGIAPTMLAGEASSPEPEPPPARAVEPVPIESPVAGAGESFTTENPQAEADEPYSVESPPAEALPSSLELIAQLLAHEVKNPLVAIKTFTQLLKDKFDDAEFRERFYDIVSSDVDRIDALIEAASAFSRFGKPHLGAVDVAEMLNQVLKGCERSVLNKRIVVLRESSGASRPARADKEQLNFALQAIISKVVYVMREGSALQIEIAAAPGNEGAGPRHLTTLRFAGGEGLLEELPVLGGGPEAPPGSLEVALAKEILSRQGGALRFQSANEDTTILTIDLPSC